MGSPHYFRETKFESFTRKLNRWNFVRISKRPETGAFEHEFFLRDDASKRSKIRCQKKHERKKTRSDLSRNLEDKKPQREVANDMWSNENKFTSQFPFFTSLSSSMEDIKKAQMEQMKRSQILNYLCAKQQYDQWQMQREMHLKTKESSQEKHEKQVSNDLKTKQHKSIPDIPQFSIESQSRIISSQQQQQQQQPQKQIPLLRKPDDTLFVPSEHNESIMQSQNNVKTKQQNQEKVKMWDGSFSI